MTSQSSPTSAIFTTIVAGNDATMLLMISLPFAVLVNCTNYQVLYKYQYGEKLQT